MNVHIYTVFLYNFDIDYIIIITVAADQISSMQVSEGNIYSGVIMLTATAVRKAQAN